MIIYKNIDEYINSFPKNIQEKLQTIRKMANEIVANGEEAIKYGMPTIRVNGKNLVHFAAFKNHIGLYPTPSAITKFEKELLKYKASKGAIQFPINEDLPIKLINKIIEYRNEENIKLQV